MLVKLVRFWYDRNKLLRTGVIWGLICQLVCLVFWYVGQNVGFGSMGIANVVGKIELVFKILSVIAAIVIVVGIGAEIYALRMDG